MIKPNRSQVLSVRLSADEKRRLEDYCKINDRPMGAAIRRAIRMMLDGGLPTEPDAGKEV